MTTPATLDPIQADERARLERETLARIEAQRQEDADAKEFLAFDKAMNRAFKGIFPRNIRRLNWLERIKREERAVARREANSE